MKYKTKLRYNPSLAYTLRKEPKSTLAVHRSLGEPSPSTGSFITERLTKKKPPGPTRHSRDCDPGGFSLTAIALVLETRNGLVQRGSAHYSLSENQLEMPFIPLRSTLLPSHTAKPMGTVIPVLNCVSLASPVSNARLMTTRQVGPV